MSGGERSASPATFVIRPFEAIPEYRACEELQRRAWGFEGDLDVIPTTAMVATRTHGGVVLGAFDPDGRLRGFCYGFLGRDDRGRWLHHSHMLAVDPELRGGGLGARLKWAQRNQVLAQGVDLMVWTHDPLESLNACFNLDKLGTVAARYHVDFYGETSSSLHRGTATDRVTAAWYLRSGRVRARRRGERGPLAAALARGEIEGTRVLEAREGDAGGPPRPGEPRLGRREERLLCEIPASIQRVKEADPEVATEWREATRAVLGGYFRVGYFARECVSLRGERPRTVYLLERGSPEPAGLSE